MRVGTQKNGNFRSRIGQHYLLGRELHVTAESPAPKDRSIFRKNLGRALICRDGIDYLDTWNIDFTTSRSRKRHGHKRDPETEQAIESEVTALLRSNFSFAWVPLADESERMGGDALEGRLIGTLANCPECTASVGWLGSHSPDFRIVTSGLWQVQHLRHAPVSEMVSRS